MRSVNRWIICVTVALLIGIQTWFLFITFNYPGMSIQIQQDQQQRWFITGYDNVKIASEIGVQIGDQVLSVEGVPPSSYESVLKYGDIQRAGYIEILRGDEHLIVEQPVQITDYDVCFIAGQLISFFMVFILINRAPALVSIRYLTLILLSIGILFMSLPASGRSDGLAKNIISTIVILIPFLFLHFLIIFMKERGEEGHGKISKLLLFAYVFAGVCFLFGFFMVIPSSLTYPVFRFLRYASMIGFVIGFAINIVFLIRLYKKERKRKKYVADIIKTIVFSLLVSFGPITLLYFIPETFSIERVVNQIYAGLFTLLFPILLSYLVVSKQLYQIDMFVKRLLFMAAMSVIPSAFFTIVLLTYVPELPVQHILLVFMLACMFCSAFLFSLEYFTKITERYFFPRRRLYRKSLVRITEELSKITAFRELKKAVLEDIVSILQVHGAAVVYASVGQADAVCEGDIEESTVKRLALDEAYRDSQGEAYTVYKINSHGEYAGYLIVTQEKENTYVSPEDRQWLQTVIGHLTVSMENLYLIRSMQMKMQQIAAQIPNEDATDALVWFRKVIFDMQEKERTRIATDLHDTTLQDLFFLKRRIADMRDGVVPADRKGLQDMIEFIDILNVNLRQSCYELHPHLIIEVGLVESVRTLIEQEQFYVMHEVDFQTENEEAIEELDIETKRHLFRVVQELLNNAKKHAEAERLHIRLAVQDRQVEFAYEDDGVGFDEDILNWQDGRTSGLGMRQLKSRIISLDGQFDLQSSRGNGLKVRAVFPYKKEEYAR